MPSPSAAMPQPVPWVRATTPSTFGKSASRPGARGNVVGDQLRATVAEQFTEVRMPM